MPAVPLLGFISMVVEARIVNQLLFYMELFMLGNGLLLW